MIKRKVRTGRKIDVVTTMQDEKKTKEQLLEELRELRQRAQECEKIDYELEVRSFELKLRLKELNCLFNISKLIDNPDLSFEDLIQGIVDLIPTGWQYPNITYARAQIHETEYKTENYNPTEWKERRPIVVDSQQVGFLEVGYVEKTPKTDGSYFLPEELNMLRALAEQIERLIMRKQTEERLKYYASVDTMTGTLNRRTGLTVLEEQMRLMKRNKSSLSICYLDANNLKYVNDTFGHDEGDELIIILTDIIRSSIRISDTLCRLGGDEFLIILPDCHEPDAEKVWDKIRERLDTFNLNDEKPYNITVSHGCAEFGWEDNLLSEKLLATADRNMYAEKEQYKTE